MLRRTRWTLFWETLVFAVFLVEIIFLFSF